MIFLRPKSWVYLVFTMGTCRSSSHRGKECVGTNSDRKIHCIGKTHTHRIEQHRDQPTLVPAYDIEKPLSLDSMNEICLEVQNEMAPGTTKRYSFLIVTFLSCAQTKTKRTPV